MSASLDNIFAKPSTTTPVKPSTGGDSSKPSLDNIFAGTGSKKPTVVAPTPTVDPVVAKLVDATPVTVPKTSTLFSKTIDFLTKGLTPGKQQAFARPEPKAEKPGSVMHIEDTGGISQYFADHPEYKTSPGQEVKYPFVDAGTVRPSNSPIDTLFKNFIEFPEKATRSLSELVGISKPDSATRKSYYTVPSYAETSGKTTGQLIDEGIPSVAAVILGSAQTGGEFANDALMYEGILSSGAKAVASRVAAPAESQVVAYDFLGRPKTLQEAEKAYYKIQQEYHPDKLGGDASISAQANDAIAIIRKEGIPTQDVISKAIDTILNKPVSELFKSGDIPKGTHPSTTIKGFLEDADTIAKRKVTLKEEIRDALDTHGPEQTQMALQERLGVDAPTANKLIAEARSEAVLANASQVSQDTLAGIVKPTPTKVSLDNIFEKGTAVKPTTTPTVIGAAPVNTSSVEVADAIREWINQEKKLPEKVMQHLSETKPGVNELKYNTDNTITLYRDKVPTPGKIESYSITQKSGQEPFTIHKDQIIANLAGKDVQEIFNHAYPEGDVQSQANKEMLQRYSKLEQEVFVKNKPEIAADSTELLVNEAKKHATPEKFVEQMNSGKGRNISTIIQELQAPNYSAISKLEAEADALRAEFNQLRKEIGNDTAFSENKDALRLDAEYKAKKQQIEELKKKNSKIYETNNLSNEKLAELHKKTTTTTPTEGSGKESRVYKRLQAENPSLTDEVKYDDIKLKEDAQKAVELVEKDKNQAYRIAMGLEESSDVTSTAVNIAMAEKALDEGNLKLYGQLVKNRSLAQTRRGQEIVAEKGSVTDNSTSRYVKELINTRLTNLGKKHLTGLKLEGGIKKVTQKENALAAIDKEVKKVKAKIKATKQMDLAEAQKLIDSLAC